MEKVLLRTSERSDFMRCPQRWDWAYNARLRPLRVATALRLGDLVHQALAAYYISSKVRTKIRRGPPPAKTFEKLYQEQVEELGTMKIYTEPDDWVDALELGIEMLKNYVAHYGKDERYLVISPEMPIQLDVHDPETDEYVCTYVGTLDACVEDLEKKEIGLMEHKTAKAITTVHLSMDEQATSYWAFAPDFLRSIGVLKPGQDLEFILYNFLRKAKKDEREQNAQGQYLNQNGSVSKNQPAPFFHRERVYRSDVERRNVMLRVIDQAHIMAGMRAGEIPITKSPLNGCTGMYSCTFRDMCEIHETGSDWEAIRDSTFETWDPYEVHDDSAEAGSDNA